MDLTHFPIDEQLCFLHISSCKYKINYLRKLINFLLIFFKFKVVYSSDEVKFYWRNPIKVSKKIRIAQFDLLGTEIDNENYTIHNRK